MHLIIAVLNDDVQEIHAAALPWLFKSPSQGHAFPPAVVAELLQKDHTLMYLALKADEPIGFVYAEVRKRPETTFTYPYNDVYIHGIGVRPGHRGCGAGTALVAEVRKTAAEMNIMHIAADFWMFNMRAASFFKRHGFEVYRQVAWVR